MPRLFCENTTDKEQQFMTEFYDTWWVLFKPEVRQDLALDQRKLGLIKNRLERIGDLFTTCDDLEIILQTFICVLGYFDGEEAAPFGLIRSMQACPPPVLKRRRAFLVGLL